MVPGPTMVPEPTMVVPGSGKCTEVKGASACAVDKPSISVKECASMLSAVWLSAQELGERLLRWGRVLACKQLLFLLYVIGRMCPQRIHQMEALQNGIMMEELHYMLNASPPTL